MSFMRIFCFLYLFCCCSFIGFAQNKNDDCKDPSPAIIMDKIEKLHIEVLATIEKLKKDILSTSCNLTQPEKRKLLKKLSAINDIHIGSVDQDYTFSIKSKWFGLKGYRLDLNQDTFIMRTVKERLSLEEAIIGALSKISNWDDVQLEKKCFPNAEKGPEF